MPNTCSASPSEREEIERFLAASRAEDERRAAFHAADRTIANGTKGAKYTEAPRLIPVPQTTLWTTIISCGFRWGELSKLRWKDFNADVRTFVIRAENAKGKRTRLVPVPPELIAPIEALKAANARATSRVPFPDDYIFLSPTGVTWATMAGANARIQFYAVLERAGIEQRDDAGFSVDIHALRGCCATRLLRHGVGIAHVARVLGHRDVRTTLKHYCGLEIDDTRAAMATVPALPMAGRPAATKRDGGLSQTR